MSMGCLDSLPKYVRATFRPKVVEDLRDGALVPGSRCAWEGMWRVDYGPYAGMVAFSPSVGGPWVPECDLTEIAEASYSDFVAEVDTRAKR
jgi:hypothetical protein